MSDAYTELECIWARALAGDRQQMARDVIVVLTREGISLRQKDGTLVGVTLSKPTSDPEARVIGLRYVKQDTTQTEDHFTLTPGGAIEKHHRGTLEEQWPEYRGTHKLQVDVTLYENDQQIIPTWTNTITLPPP
jgi:hypothetical protein